MVISSQILSDPEHTRVLKEARRYATGHHMSSDRYPVGETAVPSSDPNWNYNDPGHIWERDHFLICVKAGLKAVQQKVISYARVSAIITQEPSENPIVFLERVKEALQKFINLANVPTSPCYAILMMLMIIPCSLSCLTCFVSAQVNKLQHTVPVQQRCKTTADRKKISHTLRWTPL